MGKRRTTGLDVASGEDRLALEHDSILIISLVRDGAGACLDVVMEFANDAWRDDFGISERDLAGHSLFATVPALKQRLPVYLKAVQTGRPVRRVHPMPGDKRRRFAVQYEPFGDRVIVVAHETSREAGLEEALRVAEKRYTAIAETAVDAIISATDDGVVVAANPAAAALFGYLVGDVVGQPVSILVPPVHRGDHQTGMLRVAAGGTRHIMGRIVEITGLHRDGREIPIELSLAETRTGGIHLVTAIMRDISERKAAAAALEQSRNQLAEAQRIAHVGSWTWDPAADAMRWSAELFRIWGLQPRVPASSFEELQGLQAADTGPALLAAVGDAIETGGPFEVPVDVRRADGTIRHVIARGETTLGPDGTATWVQGTVADVTELREAERNAERARARLDATARADMVARLSGGIAHDFNNLLMAINGYAEALDAAIPEADALHDDVAAIQAAGLRAADLTRQMLAFGRRQTLRPVVVDLGEVVRHLAPMLGSPGGGQVEITVPRDAAAGVVRVDRALVERVLVSLVLNARDAMPSGGSVTVAVGAEEIAEGDQRLRPPAGPGAYVRLAVSDTGTGIPPDVLPHIFEPFFTTKGIGGGSGLGLSSVEGAVAQSGGFIAVETAVGRGSTFSVFLPQINPDAGRGASAETRGAQGGRLTTILVVDDEPAVLAITAHLLRSAGYTVLEAANADAAQRVAEADGRVGLLLTDVMMPGANGRVLAMRLQARWPGLPVVYMSGYSAEAIFDGGVLERDVAYLAKPFTADALKRMIREVLDQAGTSAG